MTFDMNIRKLHNSMKREFIQQYIPSGSHVLDVGCGCGGDIFKWPQGTIVTACDPDVKSIKTALTRAKSIPDTQRPKFFIGDISASPERIYDFICYNFSLQYIFASESLFRKTLGCIEKRSTKGTILMGVVPDSEELMTRNLPEYFTKDGPFTGDFGDSISFCVPGAPYYKDGPVPEPVCYREILIMELEKIGFTLCTWEPFVSFHTGTYSDVYSKFVFECNR